MVAPAQRSTKPQTHKPGYCLNETFDDDLHPQYSSITLKLYHSRAISNSHLNSYENDTYKINAKQLGEKNFVGLQPEPQGSLLPVTASEIGNLWRYQNRYLRGYKNVLPTHTFLLH